MKHNVLSCDWKACQPDRGCERFECIECGRKAPKPYVCRCAAIPARHGLLIGNWLAWLLRLVGIRKRPGCGCTKRQAEMNQWLRWG